MTKKEWLEIITNRQRMYVNQLARIIKEDGVKKTINFNSPTGTGKTVMVAMLVNLLSDANYFFLITTLSRGGLNKQVGLALSKMIKSDNYFVYGVSSFTLSTKLQEKDILNKVPIDKKLIWIRDEGHIKSNNWTKILEGIAYKIVNVSATNDQVDIQCNFTDTPLLRTPIQLFGSPRESIEKLLEIKKIHKSVPHYNPCIIVRDVNDQVTDEFISLADEYKLKIVNITDEDVNIQNLCKNDNEFDIIVNKMKITEGIDIPRGSVFYIGNRPNNEATVIQLIGRVRRNALLWNDDVDIFLPENSKLLEETTKTYIYYRVEGSGIKSNTDNELTMELSDLISFENLIPETIEVKENRLSNGYRISELSLLGENVFTGTICLSHSNDFVIAKNLPKLYQRKVKEIEQFGYKYKEVVQDKELVTISFDKTKFFKTGETGIWRTTTTVSDNIQFGKLNRFIRKRYQNEMEEALGKNIRRNRFKSIENYNNERRINHCISYLCEYYLKYLIFGESYLYPFINIAKKQFSIINSKDEIDILFYAISLCYKKQMAVFYGELINRMIPMLTIEELREMPFEIKNQIIEMAKETLPKVMQILGKSVKQDDLRCPHFGNPSIMHGVADLVFEDTLIQFSQKGTITRDDIFKVFAYHYLSTKRYDLSIKRVVLVDFRAEDYIEINVSKENLSKLKFNPAKIVSKNFFEKEANEDFKPNRLRQYYSLYGSEFTLSMLQANASKLGSGLSWDVKDSKNKKHRVYQLDLLKSASLISDNYINKKLLTILLPSKDTISFAIKNKDFSYLELNIEKVKLTSNNLMDAINLKKADIVALILNNFNKVELCHLESAITTNDDYIIQMILNRLNITKRIANDIIRTKYESAIVKMLRKIKPTTYNLIVAIKTQDINTVVLVGEKCKSITNRCLEEAKKDGITPIIDYIKKKLRISRNKIII